MPDFNQAALDFLSSRRSHSPKVLTTPVPGKDELATLLALAARSPDHGALVPWRFIVVAKNARSGLADLAEARAKSLGRNEEETTKARGQFDRGNLAVVVVESPVESQKVPPYEQTLSAGAVCLGFGLGCRLGHRLDFL